MFEWREFAAAVALMCVVEGLLPFLNPGGTRRVMTRLTQMGDRELRIGGLLSMAAGLIVLFLARS